MRPTQPKHDSEFVTIAELARQWAMSRTSVRRIPEQAPVPAYHFGAGRNSSIRFLGSDIDAFPTSVEKYPTRS
jgi:hypothetical protein